MTNDALTKSICASTALMFENMRIAMKTCDWQADICGAPVWRYLYHTIHSCDKFFVNPTRYDEPDFHVAGIDWPDHKLETVLTREQIEGYYFTVRDKILAYLDGLADEQLAEIPDGCVMSRVELILSQFRHMYAHIGIINGVTIAATGRYPRIVNESKWGSGEAVGLFDEDARVLK
jgi:hypothetical protein